MGAVRTTVFVGLDLELGSRAYRSGVSGEAVASLVIGDAGEVALFGSPAGLRRLALEAVRAAEDAEQLDGVRERVGVAA
jgi:hypothetical protein